MAELKHYTESIYYEMELTAKVMKLVAAQFFSKAELGLIPDEYITLDFIACNSGICQRDLAKLILKDRANTGRLVSSLEEKGFVSRNADTKNNRLIKKLSLTEAGAKKLSQITKNVKQKLEETSKIVSQDEINKLKNGLKTFRTSLEKLIDLKI